MFEIKIAVSCPDLLQAATIFATAMGGIKITEPNFTKPASAPAVTSTSTAQSVPAVTPSVNQAAPVNPVAVNPTNGRPSMMASMMSSCPSNTAPDAGVPLAQAPTFTPEQVARAGAALLSDQPGKMQELMGLLAQFGVQTVDALRPDQLGPFATALRGMGARI